MDLKTAAAFYASGAGYDIGGQLPWIAADALVAGLDSPSLEILAGESDTSWTVILPLFLKTLEELNIALPEKPEAYRIVAQRFVASLLQGEAMPLEAAKQIEDTLGPDSRFERLPEDVNALVHSAREYLYYFDEREYLPPTFDWEAEEQKFIAEARALMNKKES